MESDANSLEQYGRRNNVEITGIPDSVEINDLEGKVIEVLSEIDVNVSTNDIEACHRIGKTRNNSKKTIVRFMNRKNAKKALFNRRKLNDIDKRKLGLSNNIFISENLSPQNNKISYHCRRLKRSGQIEKTYTRDGIINITSQNIKDGKPVKIYHLATLTDLFPDFDLNEDAKEEDPNVSMQSSY